jgi:hypothetical protein
MALSFALKSTKAKEELWTLKILFHHAKIYYSTNPL